MEQGTTHLRGERYPGLWEIAKKRASFKYHLASYVVVNAFLWTLWYFMGSAGSYNRNLPWPLFSMLGWGIGLFFHFMGAYVYPKQNMVEKEYQQLVQQNNLHK